MQIKESEKRKAKGYKHMNRLLANFSSIERLKLKEA